MSSEPAYILDNGNRVPYIPKEITTHREAYAATLHVLFKHVADFHICIVKAFSKKYGIPEDDIMQTIQESDEFKNMAVDPVLHPSDPLGYLTPAELAKPAEPAAEPVEPVVMKKIVKKKQPVVPVVVPVVVPAVPVTPNADNEKIIRKKPALKKQTHAQEPQQDIQAPQQEPQRNDSERNDSERNDSVSYNSQDSLQISPTDATVIKKKIIKKKIVPEKQAQSPQELQQEPPQAADVQIAPADATVIKKIIRKKK